MNILLGVTGGISAYKSADIYNSYAGITNYKNYLVCYFN